MSAEKKVYLVTSGSYSDYGVNAVFDSRELAEAMIRGRDGYSIEEFVLNPGEQQYRAGQSLRSVTMRHDGSGVVVCDFGFAMEPSEDRIFIEQEQGWEPGPRAIVAFVLECDVWSKDETHAIKVANERRGQWIADGRW